MFTLLKKYFQCSKSFSLLYILFNVQKILDYCTYARECDDGLREARLKFFSLCIVHLNFIIA
jgi:hypothetical protein